MDKWTFGLTLTVVGVSGTFLTLWILSLVIGVMKRVYPLAPEDADADKRS